MINQEKLKKGCIFVVLIYVVLAISFYLICGPQLHYRDEISSMVSPMGIVGEITKDTVVEQRIVATGEMIKEISLFVGNYERDNTGNILLEFLSGEKILASKLIDTSTFPNNAACKIQVSVSIPDQNEILLRITAPETEPGNAITLYYGDSIQSSHMQVNAIIEEKDFVKVNGQPLPGKLCVELCTRKTFLFGTYYWYFALAILGAIILYCKTLTWKNKTGKNSMVLNAIFAMHRYSYLIKQLVERDFKIKYKRSVLGIFWSFLNPLLTMTVQYIVFSTVFRSNIPNFALYLIVGIVCFSFFSEATSMSLLSIVGNAALITKVYVPKYIYPLTRVMSSSINFLLALIPLFIVMPITHTPFKPAALLLPLPVCCLFAVSLGIGMLLASLMVFFRDTQFLWNVIIILWMYATPIFYPESILPDQWLHLFKCNPLYHIIRFIRIILMDGISPEPKAYGLMIFVSLVFLSIGAIVFKKTQDRFILNI